MFMEKVEIDNAIKLTKVKLRNLSLVRPLLVIVLLLLVSLGGSLSLLFQRIDQVKTVDVMNFSNILFFAGTILSLSMAISYRANNEYYSVFPQTNFSRFLSSQIINYSLIFSLGIAALITYLIQYGIYGILTKSKDNIFMVYSFNLEYLLAGLMVFLLYLFLICGGITFIAVVLRKFRIYAIIGMVAFLSLVFYNDFIKGILSATFGFFVNEGDLLLFVVKALVAWLLLLGTSFIINDHTIYYKTDVFSIKPMFAVAVVVVILSSIIITSLTASRSYTGNTPIVREESITLELDRSELDVSHFPPYTLIEVYGLREDTLMANNIGFIYGDNMESAPPGKIIIETKLPLYIQDGMDINEFINPQITIKLEDNKVFIDYIYDKNVKVVLLSPWPNMWQFDRYKGKGLLKEQPGSSTTRGSGYIKILLPQDMEFDMVL